MFAAERSVGKKYRPITACALRAPCSGRRRSAANAGNCILRADERISTQTSPNSLNSSGAGGVRNVVPFFVLALIYLFYLINSQLHKIHRVPDN